MGFQWFALAGDIDAGERTGERDTTTRGSVFRVDDSGTVVLDPVLEMQWQPPGRASIGSPLVSASTRVSVQLNLLRLVGEERSHLYVLAPHVWTHGAGNLAFWGNLAPGSLISGDRAIVYAGPINGSLLRDVIDIVIWKPTVRD